MPDEMNKREVILTIREYENSVAMPEGERVTYLDPRGGVHLKDGDDKAPDYTGHAAKCAEYLRFGDDVDLASCGGMEPINQIKVCDTPALLIEAGFSQKPMLYTQRHLMDALHSKSEENYHWHGLEITQMKRLPYLLENPVLLSDSPSRKDALLAVLAEVDGDKLPLIVAIKPDGKGNYELQEIETNFILSVYGKDDFAKYFSERITPDKLVYFNMEQGRKLEALAELQLFRCHPVAHDLDSVIIRQPQCIVNSKTAGQHGYSLKSEVEVARSAAKEPVNGETVVTPTIEQSR